MQIKFDVFWKKNLGTLYKDNSIDVLGKEAIVDLDLKEVSNIYVNFKVNDKSFTDLVEIVDIEKSLIRIPFKTDVIKVGTNELELVATMKNGDVKPSQTFTYTVDKSLENPNSVEADTNYPVLIELMDLAGNKLIDMDKSIQKVNTSIENMTNDISNYKETTTNALNSDISSYKETTTKELENNFNNYSNNITSNITRVLDNKIVEVDNVVSVKSNELDVKFTTKSNEITKTLNDEITKVDETLNSEINKVNTTLTNKVNEVDEALDTTVTTINTELDEKSKEVDNKVDAKIVEIDNRVNAKITDINTSLNNKINEVNEVIEEVELSEQARKEEHTELVSELSSYSSDMNNVKDRVDVLEAKITDNEVIVDLKNKVNNHEERITTSEKTIRHQGILLNALNDLDDTISIEEEGTIISLPQSDDGKIIIDELQGNTLVNYCTNGSEELTLNNEINAQGTDVTLTDTVDNSKVDVVCEGNTLVNLANFKGSFDGREITSSKSEFIIDTTPLQQELIVGKTYSIIDYSIISDVTSLGAYSLEYNSTENFKKVLVSCLNKKVAVFTVPNDYNNFKHIYVGTNGNQVNLKLKAMILEGDWTDKEIPQYFEGMKSAFELEDNKVEIVSGNSDNTLSNTHSIQLSEPLRGLPNGVCDKFVKQGGKWYVERNCRKIVLDGTISFSITKNDGLSGEDNTVFNILVPGSKYYKKDVVNSVNNKLPTVKVRDDVSFEYMYKDGWNENFFINLKNSNLTTLNVSGLLEWLSRNPIELIYELATPIYEEITDPQVITYLDTTHISTNSTIPCNMKVTNSGYNAIIKPSTQYTVAFDTNASGEVNIGLGGAKTSTTNNVATITTPSTLTGDSLRLYGKGIKASNVRLLEGDKTNYIPSYFEGMKSCFEDKEQDNGSYEVEIISSNLDNSKSNSIQLQLNEPLRAVGDVKDRFVLKDGKLMIERNCGIREYQEGDFELDNTLTDKTNTTYILNGPTYEEVPYEAQKLTLECFENGTLFIDTLIPPTVSVTYSANKPVVAKLNQVDNTTNVNTEDIAITQMAVDFLLMSSLGEEMINFKIKGGTNMSAYFASRIIKGALKYEDVISKYPNYKEDIDLILIAEGYSDLIVEL